MFDFNLKFEVCPYGKLYLILSCLSAYLYTGLYIIVVANHWPLKDGHSNLCNCISVHKVTRRYALRHVKW